MQQATPSPKHLKLNSNGYLLLPDAQPITPRLGAAASLRYELEALLAVAPHDATPEVFRTLIVEQNVAGKSTALARRWVWKRIRLRYVLDPAIAEFRIFRACLERTSNATERGLLCLLLAARTDRLLRELTLELISPHLPREGTRINAALVREAIEHHAHLQGLHWSPATLDGLRSHFLAILRDFGLLQGALTRRTIRLRSGPQVVAYAAWLARLEGLTDRQALTSRWFRLLGLDREGVIDLMYAAQRSGALQIRLQAEVVELLLPDTE